jgi:hypothetical protein
MVRTIGGEATTEGEGIADATGEATPPSPGDGEATGLKRGSVTESGGGRGGVAVATSTFGRAPLSGRVVAGAQAVARRSANQKARRSRGTVRETESC